MAGPEVGDITYKYERLGEGDSFRMLELEPGAIYEPISCRIKPGRLNDGQKYEALSYAWGEASVTHEVLLDGSPARISTNLFSALRAIRDKSKPLVLWADQLSINQADVAERSRQVRIMGDIYRYAESVAVFVEDSTHGDGSAVLGVVKEMNQRINQQLAKYHRIAAIPPAGPDDIAEYESLDWHSFRRLATSSWNSRTWIRQEVGFARSVRLLYQGVEFKWEDVMMLDRWLRSTGLALRSHLRIPDLGCRLWASFDPQSRAAYNPFDGNFLTILRMSEGYDASDPRDKIYGLLGHPTARRADGTLLVKPQYNWTLREVYIDFARKWLDNEKDATILNYAVFTEKCPMLQTVAVFPSWCPQWHVRCGLYASLGVRTATVDYNTSGNSKVDHQWLARDQLEIKGFTFGTISEAFEVFSKGHVSYQKRDASTCGVRTFSSIIYAIMKRLRLLSLVHGSTAEALAMTISASHAIGNNCFTSDDNTAAGRRLQHEAFCNFLSQQAELDSGFNLDDFPGIRASASAEGKAVMRYYQRCVERYPTERRVCVVDGMNGKYLCLGPGVARENDVICILFGAMTPFVLRPVSNGMHLLIGDCYVHDIMYGEAMEAFRSSPNGKESFIII